PEADQLHVGLHGRGQVGVGEVDAGVEDGDGDTLPGHVQVIPGVAGVVELGRLLEEVLQRVVVVDTEHAGQVLEVGQPGDRQADGGRRELVEGVRRDGEAGQGAGDTAVGGPVEGGVEVEQRPGGWGGVEP